MVKSETLLKTVSVYLVYFLYSYLLSAFGLGGNTWVCLGADILFLLFIVGVYYKGLKKDVEEIKKEYSVKKMIKAILLVVLGSMAINVLLSLIAMLFFPTSTADQNTLSIQSMATVSIVYTIFKTMIFGGIAEEILFRESLSDCIPNNILFILISSVIYTAMNFVFTNTGFSIDQLLAYFLPALFFSYVYIKNNRNIFVIIISKFVYNLIPLTILLVGLLNSAAK